MPSADVAPSTSTNPPQRPQTPEEVLGEWTRALNEADIGALERLYAERVRFYGQSLSRKEVLERKRQALEKTPSFSQTIVGTPSVEHEGEVTRVGFKKRSGPKAAQSDIFATLVLGTGPQFLIQEESDIAADKKFGKQSLASAPIDCDSAVWFLVESTAEAKKLHADIDENLKSFPKEAELNPGGMGPFTPNETVDGTYQVAIGVHHPERFEAYEWFTVDAEGKVTVRDEPISTPKEALRHFRELCKPK